MAVYISFMFSEMAALRDAINATVNVLCNLTSVGRAATKAELYPAMAYALAGARGRAFVTYFSPRSPSEPPNPTEEAYHASFRRAVTDGRTVDFKRIIAIFPKLDTAKKLEWTRDELAAADKAGDYDIRFLVVEDTTVPYNVQIFDNLVFLIDPSRTNDGSQPRDIHLVDEKIAAIFVRYYSQIFDPLPKFEQLSSEVRARIKGAP
jgi:hypothetical protein